MKAVALHAFSAAALVLAVSSCPLGPAQAAATAWIGTNRVAVRLVTGVDAVGAGSAVSAGLEFRYGEGWHGYWRTPGDAGIAPRFDWAGSQNVSDATVAWPAPRRLEIAGLQNAVYTGQFTLPLRIALAVPGAATRLALALDYAACANICVPVHADLVLPLPAGDAVPSPEAAGLAAAEAAVPQPPAAADLDVWRDAVTPDGAGRTLTLVLHSRGAPFRHPDLFAELPGGGLPGAPTVQLGDGDHTATLTASLPAGSDDGAPVLTFVDGARAAEIPAVIPNPGAAGGSRDLLAILGIALLGGLILNVMPCVLPVLSLKLAGVARHTGQRRHDIRVGFALTALGILASFLALATALVTLKLSGATLGWGIQFQQPWFLAGMAVLTVLFACSFFEWLPISLPSIIGRLGGQPRHSIHADAFLTGVFSTLLATPCSAPFVGTAVGFALSRGPVEIVAVFASLGLGMALPFLLVAALPGLVGWLPRPGAWMLGLRRGLGVLLLATAAWLVFVLRSVAGAPTAGSVAVMLVGLLLVRAWTTRRDGFAARPWVGPATAGLAVLAIATAVVGPASVAPPAPAGTWEAFDPAAIDRAVAAGRTVLVDVAASWCLTCKVNDLSTLDSARVRDALSDTDTLRMRADWSRPNPAIAAYLQRFGRFGIPLDVVYGPGQPKGEALPELLTPDLVLGALDRARANTAALGPRTP